VTALSPFPVDPEVLRAIRPMQFRDAGRVAALHRAAMGNSLWAQLGLPFLQQLYQAMVDSPWFVGFVYVEDGDVKGFIGGSLDTAKMYRDIARRRFMFLGPAAAVGALRRPRVVAKLVETWRYFGVSGADDVPGESLFCSFEPQLRGRRVAGHINKVLFDELFARGHEAVKITTEVDNEGANRQLRSWGFEERQRFRFYGKEMVTYVLVFAGHPRVEKASRHPAV
jgi:ribosomal protein S18 acetylase RimI-like enzyme